MKNENNLHLIGDEKVVLSADDDPGYTQAICPATMALLSESTSEFNHLLAAFRSDYRPANTTEDALVQLLARHFWSALRNARIESGLVQIQMDGAGDSYRIQQFIKENNMRDPATAFECDTRKLGFAFQRDCEEGNGQLKIARLAGIQDAGFLRIQSRLQKLQALRISAAPRKNKAA
jgi:hypothetical protein